MENKEKSVSGTKNKIKNYCGDIYHHFIIPYIDLKIPQPTRPLLPSKSRRGFWRDRHSVNFCIIAAILFLLVVMIGGGVDAVGQQDVLNDIQGLAELYYNNRCADSTNISFGSLEGCDADKNSTFQANHNIGLALLAMYGKRQHNVTLINATIDGLLAMARMQDDGEGDWPQGAKLQDDGDVVQSYFTAIALADAFEKINSNITTTNNQTIKDMFADYINGLMVTPTTNNYDSGNAGGADRLADFYFRKRLNITFTQINSTDNIHLVIRLSSLGNPQEDKITFYIGSNQDVNYSYQTNFSNLGITDLIEVRLNKSHVIDNCAINGSEYLCNFTLLRNNAIWNSSHSYNVIRGVREDPLQNNSWTSPNGSTFAVGSNEYFIRLKFYQNDTVDKAEFKRATANQFIARALSCYRVSRILTDAQYSFSRNIAERCFINILQNVTIDQKDGVFGEWNEQYRDYGGNSSRPDFPGYSHHYNWISAFSLLQLYNLTNNLTYLRMVNDSFNNLSYFNYGEKLSRANGFGTRDSENITSLSASFNSYPFLASLSYMDGHNQHTRSFNAYTRSYLQFFPNTSFQGITRYGYDTYPIIYLYEAFPSAVNNTPMNTDASRYFSHLSTTGLIAIGTASIRAFLGYKNNSVNAAIGYVVNRQNSVVLFHGDPDAQDNTKGLGVLVANNSTSAFDTRSRITVMSSNYPYQLNYYGNLTNVNTSNISTVTYNTTFIFYDDYIEANQSTSAIVELQLWERDRTARIDNGTIRGIEINYNNTFNNATFIPFNFVFSYNDTSDETELGTVDKFNASGTSFWYIVQMNESGTFYARTSDYILLNNSESGTPSTKNIPIYDATNALVRFSNGSVACSDISSCDGNVNITLAPQNYSYVLDNFNITENIIRDKSPIWIKNYSDDGRQLIYRIASNLTQTIHNVTFFLRTNVSCSTVEYTSNTSLYKNTVSRECGEDGYIKNITLSGLEPATNSNILYIKYDTTSGSGGGQPSDSLSLTTSNVTNVTINNTKINLPSIKSEYNQLEILFVFVIIVVLVLFFGNLRPKHYTVKKR